MKVLGAMLCVATAVLVGLGFLSVGQQAMLQQQRIEAQGIVLRAAATEEAKGNTAVLSAQMVRLYQVPTPTPEPTPLPIFQPPSYCGLASPASRAQLWAVTPDQSRSPVIKTVCDLALGLGFVENGPTGQPSSPFACWQDMWDFVNGKRYPTYDVKYRVNIYVTKPESPEARKLCQSLGIPERS